MTPEEPIGGVPVVLRVRWVRSGFNPRKAYPHYEVSIPRSLLESSGMAPGMRLFCYYYPKARSFVFVANPPDFPHNTGRGHVAHKPEGD